MKMLKASGTLAVAVLAAFATPTVIAADEDGRPGWYVGGGIGQSREWNHHGRITTQLSPLITNSIDDDSHDTGFKLFAGKKINKNFAVEAGYFNLGKFGFTAHTTPTGTFAGTIKVQGVNADVLGILPVTDKFSAFGRLGLQYAQSKDNFRGTGAVAVLNPSPKKNDTNIKYGAGLQYAFTDSLALRGEWERYRINDAVGHRGNIDMLLVGLVYTFGEKAPAPAPRAAPAPVYVPPPAPVAAAPAPVAPVVVPAPVPIVLRQVSFSADSLFGYDKSDVRPAGKQHLDQLAADLKGTTFDTIIVTGHTDRIGSRAYNQKLSERRAESVKTYLVQSGGIPASKISARGAGASSPVTKLSACKGAKVTSSLKDCLQADRRVEVTVTGTK